MTAPKNCNDFAEAVWKAVETMRDSPEARFQSRKAFYLKYGEGTLLDKYGFGDSEIAFLHWEQRGVLKSPTDQPPGSAWWSAVNLWFIYLSELGAKAYETGICRTELPIPAQLWIDFIQNPNSVRWYRAHNSSIIDAYLKYPHLAVLERLPEQIFINMVLYRLLYAQSWVEGDSFFPELCQLLANPKGKAVELITHIDAFYPAHYPLTEREVAYILGTAPDLVGLSVEFFDKVLIEPQLTALYQKASIWNQQPNLTQLVRNDEPIYPNLPPDTYPEGGKMTRFFNWFRQLGDDDAYFS